MNVDWKVEIAKMFYAKQALHRTDKEELWPWHLPEVAATEDELATTEDELGFSIDPEYRDFLRHANGWKGFFHDIDLFGTFELKNVTKNTKVSKILKGMGYSLARTNVSRDAIFPIGVSRNDIDLFTIVRHSLNQSGEVIWFAGGEIDRFQSFTDFFLAMIEHVFEELKDIQCSE